MVLDQLKTSWFQTLEQIKKTGEIKMQGVLEMENKKKLYF